MDELQRLLAERACERLVALYARCVDLRKGEGLGELFTEDGVLDVTGTPLAGRAAIEAALAAGIRGRLMRHVCTNVMVEVTGEDRATGTCYLTAYVQAPGDETLSLPAVMGEYHDEFRRTAEGWRITHRHFQPALRRAD